MTKHEMTELVERYFASVDAQDLEGTLSVLAPDCCLAVPTAGVRHCGRDTEIRRMCEGLFDRFESLWHGDFRHVADVEEGTIASGFVVRNVDKNGARDEKHNCNFFTIRDGQLSAISVYMMGENTLN